MLSDVINRLHHTDLAIRFAHVALGASNIASGQTTSARARGTIVKTEDELGTLAIQSEADRRCQEFTFRKLKQSYPESAFLMEEPQEDPAILGPERIGEVNKGLVFVIDPIDGSTEHEDGRWEFAHTMAARSNGSYVTSITFAPRIRLMGISDIDRGTTIIDTHMGTSKSGRVLNRARQEITILKGVDMDRFPQFGRFLQAVSYKSPSGDWNARLIRATGSCALGMLAVSAGLADVCIQPAVFPWDCAAGLLSVTESGGHVILFHYRQGVPVRLSHLDLPSFDPLRRQTAFIAGHQDHTEWLWELLVKYWQKQ